MSTKPYIVLFYGAEGKPTSEWMLEQEYQRVLNHARISGKTITFTSTMGVLTRIRVGVMEGECTAEVVTPSGRHEPVTSQGMIADWSDIPDFGLDLISRLMKGQKARRS